MDNVEASSDLEMLDYLRNELYKTFKEDKKKIKLTDLLKVIEMKKKLSVAGEAEKKFWQMINELREETLPGKKKRATRRKKNGKEK